MSKPSLDDLRARAVSFLRAAANSDGYERTTAARNVAEALLDIRCLPWAFGDDGEPDWLGKSGGYKQLVADIYSEANVVGDHKRRMQAVVRYHINELMHKRFSDEELDAIGLRKETLDERRAARVNADAHTRRFIWGDEPIRGKSAREAESYIQRLMDRMNPSQRVAVIRRLARTHRLPNVSPDLERWLDGDEMTE